MRYRANPDWEPSLRAQPEFKLAMGKITVEVAAAIRLAAEPSRHTGYFIRHIEVVGSEIRLTDWGWHFTEYGSVHNPPYAPARRGIRMAGLRFNDPRNPG